MTTAVFLTLRAPVGPHRPSRKKASIDQLPEEKKGKFYPQMFRGPLKENKGKKEYTGVPSC